MSFSFVIASVDPISIRPDVGDARHDWIEANCPNRSAGWESCARRILPAHGPAEAQLAC